jgi:hypothetical protein
MDHITGPLLVDGPLYVGNSAGDNGTDSITAGLCSGSTSQFSKDQIGWSLTSIWNPDSANPPSPYHFGYDSLIFSGLGATNTVASLNLLATGAFSANWGLTASAGKSVVVSDGVGFVANPSWYSGVGSMSFTRNAGFWAKNQGSSHVGTSYGLRIDAQTGSGTNYAIYTDGAGLNRLGDVLQTSGKQSAITYKNSNYSLTKNDEVVLADASSGNIVMTLPVLPASSAGAEFTVKKIDVSVNTVTLSGAYIDNQPTYVLSSSMKYVRVIWQGSEYFVIGNN